MQVTLAGMWLVDALLQLQPHMFTGAFVSNVLEPSAHGQPGWVSWLVTTNAHVVGTNVGAWNAVFAGVQLLVGVGLLMRATVKPALVLSVAWAVGVWSLGEGFGMVFTGNANALMGAPGAVLLYALVGLMAWPASHPARWTDRVRGPIRARVARAASGSRAASTESPLGDVGGRLVWAVLWGFDAMLWLLPANTTGGSIGHQITSMAAGEPGWLAHLLDASGGALASVRWNWIMAVALAAVSVVIGTGPLVSRRTPIFLVAGAALSLAFWVFGQAFGQLLTGPVSGTATDPNAGPLVVLMALALLPGGLAVRRRGGSALSPSQGVAHEPPRAVRVT